MGINKVIIIGNLGADPEMRYMPNGQPVTNYRVASSRRYTDNEGQTIEETEWFYIVCYGKLAENCNQYLAKGAMAYVEGRARTRQWVDKEERKHYRTELIAEKVQFLTRGASDLESPDVEAIPEEEEITEESLRKAYEESVAKLKEKKATPTKKVVKPAPKKKTK